MARSFAQVKVTIWDDPDFVNLDADAQRLYFVLMTRVDLSLAGVIEWHPGRLAQLAGDTSAECVVVAARKLELSRFVIIDHETDECLLRTQVRHDDVLRRGPKTAGGVLTAWRAIYSRLLKSVVAAEVAKEEGLAEAVRKVLDPVFEWGIANPCLYPGEGVSNAPPEGALEGASGQPATSNQQPAHRASDSAQADVEFEQWWKIYPRKVGKGQARKAYTSALRKVSADELAEAAESFAGRVHRAGTEDRFIPHPATWLNGERWTDSPVEDGSGEQFSGVEGWMNA